MVLGTTTRPSTRRQQRWAGRQRGATAVEYALALSLVVVAALAGIEAVTREVGDHVENGNDLGAPDLPDAGLATSTVTTTPPSSTPATTAGSGAVDAAAALSGTEGLHANRKTWSPTVDIRVTNASTADVLIGATITVTWTCQPTPPGCGSTSPSVTQTCQVPSTGVCSFQLSNLGNEEGQPSFRDTATLTIDSITGTDPAIDHTPGQSITLDPENR